MKSILFSIAKKMAYVFAIVIIIGAVLATVSRSLRPALHQYRPTIEKMASELLQVPVTINEVSVAWYQYQPGLKLNHVTVLDKAGKNPILQIEYIGIFFSIPQSLWHWKPITSGIVLSGTEVNLQQSANGEINVQGFPMVGEQPYQNQTKFADVMAWLSAQPRVILKNVDINYTPSPGSPASQWLKPITNQKRSLTLYELSFKNTGVDHVILGKAILHQDVATDITTAVQWKGDAFDLAKIKAKIYLYVSGFSFSQWLSQVSWNGWKVHHGIGTVKVWATWNHNELRKIQTKFQLYDLALYSQTDKSLHDINRISGNLGWRHEGAQQVFAGDEILIDLPSHLWPVTSFYLSVLPDKTGVILPKSANLGYVDLSDLQGFIYSSPTALPAAAKKILTALDLKGELQNASIVFTGGWNDWQKISLNANFSQVSIMPWQQFPGLNHLSGLIKWNGSLGDLILNSKQVDFEYNSVFANPLKAEQLTGDVQWHLKPNQSWVLTIPSLQMLSSDLVANIKGTLTIPMNGSVISDLTGNFAMQNVGHVTRYLPMKIFDKGLVTWLNGAFLSGEVKTGSAILKGPINDFPFDKNNGTFQVTAETNNIDFHYAPNWPNLQQLKAKLNFSGRQIFIDLEQGKIEGIPLSAAHAAIPYLGDAKPQVLYLSPTEIKTDFAQGLKFVHASPLEKTLGKMFNGMDASGAIKITLGLTVPLANPDKTQVKGSVFLDNSDVKFVPWNLTINQLNGLVDFTENTTTANEMKGLLFNRPLTFSLATIPQTKDLSIVQANFTNHLAIDDLEHWLNVPFSKVAKGETDVKGSINFSLKTPFEIHIDSNLIGVSLDLPGELAKQPGASTDFSADIIVQEKQPLKLKTTYGKQISAALILNRVHNQFKLSGINLRLGGGVPEWPATSGLYITGNLPQLDWEKIKEYASQSANTENSYLSEYPLQKIDVQIGRLSLPGQTLNQIRVQILPEDHEWNIKVNSGDVIGEIDLPKKLSEKELVSAQFEKLNLFTVVSNKQASPIVVKSLPAISFVANNVSYNGMPLGQITLKTKPSGSGAVIQTLRISSGRLNLQATGNWTQSGTQLQGVATSTRVSELLNSMKLDAHNFISNKGDVKFDLNWRGPFFAPTIGSMNGRVSLKLGPGRIVDVGESTDAKMGIGRMLSIFSLQSIPRRLNLDFSDLFQKGYSFDSVTGDYTLKNGNAFTTNMQLSGPVANVAINGRIGLGVQDYDFTMSVTPVDVTSSLPVAATLIGGPVGGIAALAVNTVVGSQISKAVTYHYVVRGPWSNPTWSQVR